MPVRNVGGPCASGCPVGAGCGGCCPVCGAAGAACPDGCFGAGCPEAGCAFVSPGPGGGDDCCCAARPPCGHGASVMPATSASAQTYRRMEVSPKRLVASGRTMRVTWQDFIAVFRHNSTLLPGRGACRDVQPFFFFVQREEPRHAPTIPAPRSRTPVAAHLSGRRRTAL